MSAILSLLQRYPMPYFQIGLAWTFGFGSIATVAVLGVVTVASLLKSAIFGGRNASKFKWKLVIAFGSSVAIVFFVLPYAADRIANRVSKAHVRYPEVSEDTKRFYRSLWIADMYSDSLMW
jgi:hypothetical protein